MVLEMEETQQATEVDSDFEKNSSVDGHLTRGAAVAAVVHMDSLVIEKACVIAAVGRMNVVEKQLAPGTAAAAVVNIDFLTIEKVFGTGATETEIAVEKQLAVDTAAIGTGGDSAFEFVELAGIAEVVPAGIAEAASAADTAVVAADSFGLAVSSVAPAVPAETTAVTEMLMVGLAVIARHCIGIVVAVGAVSAGLSMPQGLAIAEATHTAESGRED